MLLTQMLIPVCFLIMALLIVRTLPGIIDTPPPLPASLSVSDVGLWWSGMVVCGGGGL